jgi:hypothetical protein
MASVTGDSPEVADFQATLCLLYVYGKQLLRVPAFRNGNQKRLGIIMCLT